jgi:hypothetical protein
MSNIVITGIDQIAVLAPAKIQPIPFAAIEREAGDGQRFARAQVFLTQSLLRPDG